jgi:hypothetical protein
MVKEVDIELIFKLVNKKGSLQRVNAAKIDANIQAILYLAAGKKKSPLCSGNSRNFGFISSTQMISSIEFVG